MQPPMGGFLGFPKGVIAPLSVQRKAGGFKRGDAVASSLCLTDKQSLSSRLDKLSFIAGKGGDMAANPKAVSARLEPSGAGQRAHDMRLGPQPEYVDQKRSHLNRVLIEPLTNNQLRDEWDRVKRAVGKKDKLRSNQNLSYAGIVTFGTEAQTIFGALTIEQQDAAFLDLAQRIAAKLDTALTGLVIHLDESALHAHFQIRGIADDGSMLSQRLKRAALREVQDLAAEVMAEHAPGIERGKAIKTRLDEGEDYAETVRRSVQQLHADLPAEIAAKEAELAEVQAKLQTNLDRLAKAQEEAATEGQKAEKARKRASTYEGRLQKAQGELDGIAGELARLRDVQAGIRAENQKLTETGRELDQVNGRKAAEGHSLDEALAQKKTNIETLRARKAALEAKLRTLNAA